MSRWQAESQREAVAKVYVESYGTEDSAADRASDREEFLETFADDVQRPGFDMVVAASGPRPVAYAYGFPVGDDGPSGIAELTSGGPVSGPVFVLAELMVLPDFRRDGVATRLIEQLLMRTNAAQVTVRVHPANESGVSALRAWGWTRLGTVEPTGGVVTAVDTAVEIWSRTLTT
ncbi:GNAT family N-acetyltransferase [Streptomyces paludis]|uniref:GNAT family N-acetyltransferase n=1 Tax=Streptomyces paludis TaxID=2282738 RepID=UPI0013B41355|nr:GNAT family N-acetyltransferase [Streptomyces paludis]